METTWYLNLVPAALGLAKRKAEIIYFNNYLINFNLKQLYNFDCYFYDAEIIIQSCSE